MRVCALPLLAWLLSSAQATAVVPQFDVFTGDQVFVGLCNQGSTNLDCESGVAQLRGGNFAASAPFEAAIRTPTPSSAFANSGQGEIAWISGQPVPFSLVADGAGNLVFSAGGVTLSLDYAAEIAADAEVIPLDEADTIFLRSRSANLAAGETAILTGLSFTDTLSGETLALPDNVPGAAGGSGAAYIRLFDYDFGRAWTLEGDAILNFPNGMAGLLNSALSHEVKIARLAVPSEVPLPGALALMLSGLAMLRAVRGPRGR